MADNVGAGGAVDWKQLCQDAGLSWSVEELGLAGIPTKDVPLLIQVRKALEEYLQLAGDRQWMVHRFNLKQLHAMLDGGYQYVGDFAVATDSGLKACGLPPAVVDNVLCDQDKARVALGQRQQLLQPTGLQGASPNKRQRVDIKLRPSDFGSVKKGVPYLLQPLRSDTDPLQQSKACFITGRPMIAPVRGALSAALLAPEFGLILDAFWRDLGNPTPYYFQQAHKLLSLMRKVYPDEKHRQEAYMEWHNDTYPGLKIGLPDRSTSTPSPSIGEPASDGTFAVPSTSGESRCAIVLEAKNELGAAGDPHLQGLRYYQILIGDGQATYDYLEAMGHPAFLIGLSGPHLDISAMYRTDSNQVVLEPLTPLMSLTFDPLRQPTAMASLARVLMALGVAGWGLVQRLLKFQTPNDDWLQGCQEQRVLDAVTWAAGYEGNHCRKWFGFVQSAANDLKALCGQRAKARDLVPYPLWTTEYEGLRLLLPTNSNRLVYAATRLWDGVNKAVVIKLTSEKYPEEVHRVWSGAQVAPELCVCESLPGGGSLVAMEKLGADWSTLDMLEGKERQLAKEAARKALAQAHELPVTVGSKKGVVVHGDARGPNIMVRRLGEEWDVRFVDLDWAGFDGVARYSFSLNPRINWHHDAKQGAIMRQEHDRHLLDSV
ncbi:hypothetical protein KFL_004310020 [Klebsormidium nitens]|uniref:Aminoglycoside phosphotransferase domain-containing protein n=1 Tax=Klebsormidium nitens TaxID=105231 RepID=A0A1Y1IBX2_KLENI|nr:hypothetical protein KFL_004310020 [Klebsormidium nitens]|eukprot:GAQ88464.1 hypothetical protein KFL_004310020 [Klebsormidium nitens]